MGYLLLYYPAQLPQAHALCLCADLQNEECRYLTLLTVAYKFLAASLNVTFI